MDQSRRDALKKLSLATGVGAVATTEWAKPVVNALVVPAHAQTTSGSSSGTPTSSISLRYVTTGTSPNPNNDFTVRVDNPSTLSITSSSVVVAFGETIPYAGNFGSTLFFKKVIAPAPYSANGSYQVTVDSVNYVVSGTFS